MTTPASFLTELAHGLAASTLYAPGHPARERAIDSAYQALVALRTRIARPAFTFLGDEVVCGNQPLRELRGWDWAARLADAGIQRLEFEEGVTRAEFEEFAVEVLARLSLSAARTPDAVTPASGRIRFGSVGVRGESVRRDTPTATLTTILGAEAEAVRWIQAEARTRRLPQLAEAQAVVASLAVALNDDQTLLPLLRLAGFDQYTTYHALNVTTLTMAFCQCLGLGKRETRALGTAALLHDIGKMRIPVEILNKTGRLTAEELGVVQRHPGDGARLILQAGDAPEIAAVVAYEHHISYDGGGYPAFRYRRACHYASRLVHLCDVYDALRSPRPYREAWTAKRVLSYIDARAGTEFDPQLGPVFTRMMNGLEEAPAVLDEPGKADASDPLRKSA